MLGDFFYRRPDVKANTILQPWASLIVWGEKRFETRNWQAGSRRQFEPDASTRVRWRVRLSRFFSHLQLHLHVADLNDIADVQRLFLAGVDTRPVHVGAVGAVQIFDRELVVFEGDKRVLA